MAKMDWGFDEEAQRLSGRLPGEGGGGGGGAPSSTPAPNRARAAGEQTGAFARRAGQNLRTGAVAGGNRVLGAAETAVNNDPFVSLVRNTANATNQFKAGFTGQAAPPDIAPLELPRLRDRGGAAGVAVEAAGGPKRPAKVRGGAPMAESFDRGRPMPTAPAGLNMNNPDMPAAPGGLPDGVTKTVGADGVATYTGTPGATPSMDLGTFTGAQAPLTRAAAQTGAPGMAVMPSVDLQGDTVARTLAGQRALTRQTRADAAAMLNPASQEAELMRRAENAAGSYFLKGRPGARNAIVGATLDQLSAGNAASAAGQAAGNAALQGGQTAAAQGVLAGQKGIIDDKLKRTEIEGAAQLEGMRLNAPTREVGADGVVRTVRGDTASPVLDETGQPLRAPQQARSGAITPQDLLKAYNERFKAIQEAPVDAEVRAAQLAELQADPMFQSLLGSDGGPVPGDTAVNAEGKRLVFTEQGTWEQL